MDGQAGRDGPGDHALDFGFRWCRYRGRIGYLRLQDHERHGRETHRDYASRGSCIELGAALVVIYGTGQGWPLSTTHCQIGATVAVGLFEGCQGVNKELF